MARSNRKRAGSPGTKKKPGNPNWVKGKSANPATQWKTGQSGNPEGFSAEYRTAKELARNHTADAVETLANIARDGKNESARVRAAEVLIERADGKATQAVEVTGKGGGPIQSKASVAVRADEQPERTAAVLEALARAGLLPPPGAAPGVGEGADAETDGVRAAHAAPDTGGVPTS